MSVAITSSPVRRALVTPLPSLPEADPGLGIRACSPDNAGYCHTCLDRRRTPLHHQAPRRSSELSAPPSRLETPRSSLDRGRPTFSELKDGVSSGLSSPASAAVNSAFGSASRRPDHHDVFPPHFCHQPNRRASSKSSGTTSSPSQSPARKSSIKHGDDALSLMMGRLGVSDLVPLPATGVSPAKDYSPMAAGFASIRRSRSKSQRDAVMEEKRLSQRGSLELAARMFEGAA